MKTLPPAMFAGLTALLAVPFLSPCGHSLAISVVDRVVPNNVIISLGNKPKPPPELVKWAGIPLPEREVVLDMRLSKALLVTEAEMGQGAHDASRRADHEINAFGLVHDALFLLAMTDPSGLALMDQPSKEPNLARFLQANAETPEPFASRQKKRSDKQRCLVISNSPYIEISAPFLKYSAKSGQPILALASGGARITVITPQGSYYAIASKLHYRGSDNAVILEGSPLIKTGTRYYAAKSQGTLLRIDLRNNHFSANGAMHMQADVTGHN